MSNTAYQWSPIIVSHTLAAISALIVGATLLFRRKGTFNHRLFGWMWVVLMAVVAILSFGIQRNGLSWIHLLSVFTIVMLVVGIGNARRKRIIHHGKTMKGLYFGALIITGLFTLLPGRLIGQAAFG
jgi:uncharacterized membrane protein